MNTRLIKKQLGSILVKYLMVPRVTKPSKVCKASDVMRIKYGLTGDVIKNKQYEVRTYTNFKGEHQSYIFRLPHIVRYAKDTRSHHKGDVRMKHVSTMAEFNYWYKDNDGQNAIIASLRQYSKTLADRLNNPQPTANDSQDTQNDDEPTDDSNNDEA